MSAHEHFNMPLSVFRYCFIVNQNTNSKIHSSGRNKREPSHTFSEVNSAFGKVYNERDSNKL